MNGPQDMGGMAGFGPVAPEPDEPVFHADWEKRALALSLAMGGTRQWNIDISRHARERIPPDAYWSLSYYEIWLDGLDRLLAESGLLNGPPKAVPKLMAADVAPMLAKGSAYTRPAAAAPKFKAGDRVRARNHQPPGHTRLPGYLRRRAGEIIRHHGAHVYPDTNAHRAGENPQHLYTVRFAAAEAFDATSAEFLMADLFEPYLEAR